MNIVVSGGNGQIGSELGVAKADQEINILTFGRNQLDLLKPKQIETIFKKYKPTYFINAAAYTQVDKAEQEVQLAYDINTNAIIHLASLCNKYNCCLIHYSTDYVYNQNISVPLTEKHPTRPNGVYAESKREGEKNIESLCNNYVIIRTSWVYSKFGKNFVDTMLRLADSHASLNVVNDQIGAPTHAKDIAEATLQIIKQRNNKENGTIQAIYNYSNAGRTNWADFAREIFLLSGKKCVVNNTTTQAYNAPAHRPRWSVLSSAKVSKTYKLHIPLWEESLNDYLSSTGNIEAK